MKQKLYEGESLNFGQALEAIKHGQRIARTGWNGKDMFVYLTPASAGLSQTHGCEAHFGGGTLVHFNKHMSIKNVDGTVSTWVPSVNDCLADDWLLVGQVDGMSIVEQAAPITLPVIDPGPDAIEREIQAKASKAARVTPADIEAEIVSEHYFTAADAVVSMNQRCALSGATPTGLNLLTFCVLVLKNGFTVTGESACASPENFNAEIGRTIARENAINKLWPLLGFRLRDQLHADQVI